MSAGEGAWQAAFVAVGALLGEPAEAMAGALDPRALDGDGRVEALVRALASPSRDERARAMARALSEVALAVDSARWT